MTFAQRRLSFTLAALALAGALTIAFWPRAAQAAVCGSRDAIQKILSDRYQESSRGLGLVSDNGVVELYISDAGTWSILMTTIRGSTCIIAAGHTWQDLVVEEGDGPSA